MKNYPNLDTTLGELERSCVPHLIEETAKGTTITVGEKKFYYDKAGKQII